LPSGILNLNSFMGMIVLPSEPASLLVVLDLVPGWERRSALVVSVIDKFILSRVWSITLKFTYFILL
jgi:hypothetical protein